MYANTLQSDIYRSIVDISGDAILVANSKDEIISFNADEMMRIFGYGPDDLAGLKMRALLPEVIGRHKSYLDRFDTEDGGRITGFGHAVPGRRKDGSQVRLDLSVTETERQDGERRFIWTIRDVDQRLKLNTELRQLVEKANASAEVERTLLQQVRASNLELNRANEDLRKFTSIVAHDLRGPLGRIEAFVAVLEADFGSDLNGEGADILGRISRGASRMKLMLDSLLQYSRDNQAAIRGKTAKLADVVSDALSVFDMQALGVEVRLSLNDAPDAKGDPVLLSHVLQNLIGNAVKFRSERPPIVTIDAHVEGDEIRLFVADNGIGVEAKFAAKIFEMFYRLHNEEQYEGTGVGLTICRKIINDHGGRIWLDTDHPVGTKFQFTLLVADETDPEAPTQTPRPRFAAGVAQHDGRAFARGDRLTVKAARPAVRPGPEEQA